MNPVFDMELDGDSGRVVSREDCLCPICLDIFIEPVTLPCTHTFCKVCFLESVDKATLCCPLCRKRVSNWVRLHSRNKSLVNESLWSQIQRDFPQQCTRRLSGQEGDESAAPLCFPRLSEPGALRQEYEDQINKLTAQQEQERRASEEYIQTLLAEEEHLLLEQQRRHEDDERLARTLSKELNSASDPGQSRVPDVTPVKKQLSGHIDRFLCPVFRSPGPAHSSMSNKENILVRLNSSTDQPQPDYRSETDQSEREKTDQRQNTDQSEAEGGNKRKSSEPWDSQSDQEVDETQGKRSCQSSRLVGVAMTEWEAELQKRRKQEEDDRLMALMLQQELDRQERQTDRSKGSVDAYPLRASTVSTPASKALPPRPAPRHRASATITSSLSSTTAPQTQPNSAASSPSLKPPAVHAPKDTKQSPKPPSRQTTLTDLFNLHS